MLMGCCCSLEDAELEVNGFVLVPFFIYGRCMHMPCKILRLEDGVATLNFEWCIEPMRYDSMRNDYEESEIRRYLNSSMFKSRLSPQLQKLIVPSDVPYKWQMLHDDFWLLSHEEIGLDMSSLACNMRANWFLQTFTEDNARMKLPVFSEEQDGNIGQIMVTTDFISNWWLRSSDKLSDRFAGSIYAGAGVYMSDISNKYGCAPCFKIRCPVS